MRIPYHYEHLSTLASLEDLEKALCCFGYDVVRNEDSLTANHYEGLSFYGQSYSTISVRSNGNKQWCKYEGHYITDPNVLGNIIRCAETKDFQQRDQLRPVNKENLTRSTATVIITTTVATVLGMLLMIFIILGATSIILGTTSD